MKKGIGILAVLALVFWASSAWATVDQAKAYKKAFELEKAPRCAGCHTADKPKKDGDHELNDYGKKVVAVVAEPTEDTYKQVGPIPAEA